MDTKIEIKINQTDDIDDILALAKDVFDPDEEALERYHNKQDWLEKISDGGLLLTASIDNTLCGFAICVRKSEEDRLHIWNVAVSEDHRRQGIWKRLFENILDYAVFSGYQTLSLNTNKDKFPAMFSFVNEYGFVKTATEEEPDGTTKTFFVKTLR